MIQISVAVEHDFGDAGGEGAGGDFLAHEFGLLALGHLLGGDIGQLGGSGHEGHAGLIVNNLHIDVAVASENGHSGTDRSTADNLADAVFNPCSSIFFLIVSHNINF